MKKALVVLLALACLGAMAFGDATAKWSAATWYGIGYYMPSSGTMMGSYDYNWVGPGAVRVGFNYTAGDGNAGFNLRLTNKATGGGTNAVSADRINGWAKMFGGMLTVRVGELDDYTIATADWNSFGNTDGTLGIYADVSPIAGLDVGFFQKIPNAAASVAAGLTGANGNGDIVGLAYALPDLVNIAAGAKLNFVQTANNGHNIYFGANVKAVKDLTAILEANVALGSSATAITLLENVGYALGALTVGARVGEVSDSSAATAFSWGVEPTVTYKVNDMISLTVIINAYNNPSQTWMSPIDAGLVGGGVAGTMNFGGGAFVSVAQSGFTLIIGDYYGAATGSGNSLFINGDLSL